MEDVLPKGVDEIGDHDQADGEVDRRDEREFAENILKEEVDFGKPISQSLLDSICALLNSGGGVLKMKCTGSRSNNRHTCTRLKMFDYYWSKLEEKLITMIDPSGYDDVFDRKIDGDEIFLFVTAPNHLCTLEYNLYTPLDARNLPAKYDNVLKLLEQREESTSVPQVPIQNLPTLPEKFELDAVLPFHESKQIQLKCFTSGNELLHNNNRTQRDKIRRWISAFGNGSGGIIISGVDDKTGKIKGQLLEGDSKEKFKEKVSSMVLKMSEAWCFTPERGVHWDLKFFPVEGKGSQSALTVVAIYIAGMQNLGGIFTKYPRSCELRPGPDGREEVHQFNFEEWKRQMLCASGDESKGAKKSRDKYQLSNLLKGPLLTLRGSVEEIMEAFFAAKPGCPVVPEGFEENLPESAKQVIQEIQGKCSRGCNRSLLVASRSWLSCITKAENQSKEADGIICDLLLFDQELGGIHLFTLCSNKTEKRSLSYAQKTAKVIKKALVVDGGCHKTKFYVTYHLVSCTATSPVSLDGLLPDNRYTHNFQLESPRGKVKEILKSLVIVLAKFPSVLSNKQGISFFNLLTVEQFQLLHYEIERHKELWIKGAAGTGKTLVAVEFIKELRRRDPTLTSRNILYVCETVGLRQKISNLGICECVCRSSFMKKSFSDVHHVILDEVQNYESKDGNWLEKARTLVYQPYLNPRHDSDSISEMDLDPPSLTPPTAESFQLESGQHRQSAQNTISDSDSDIDTDLSESHVSKPCDTDCSTSGRGWLWIFIDINQKNHLYPSGIPDEKDQEPSFYLIKVIRNSKEISDSAKLFVSQKLGRQIEMGHDFDGEKPDFKFYSKNEEMAALKEVLQSLLREGYSERDIAILYSKEDWIPEREDLRNQLNLPKVVDALENDSKYVVVSTIRHYSGLERPVVILGSRFPAPDNDLSLGVATFPLDFENTIGGTYCGITRAMVKLVRLRER